MAFFNYVTKEITLKVVYYGPGLSGKTTNLQHLYSALDPTARGKFISLATESDRTLFFDFLPVELGRIKDFSVRFQLYTVPGQIRYNATRKLVLKGADAIVFVADSQRDMREQNIESFVNMRENLISNNIDPEEIPVLLQFNKRDLPNVLSVDELTKDFGSKGYPSVEAIAVNGKGVEETFRLVTKILLKDMVRKHKVEVSAATEEIVPNMLPDKGVSSGESVSLRTSGPEQAGDLAHPGKEEIFPEVRNEPVSVKIPDSAVFEMKDTRTKPKAPEERGTASLPMEGKMPPSKEQIVPAKTHDESAFELEHFGAPPYIAASPGTDAPIKAKVLSSREEPVRAKTQEESAPVLETSHTPPNIPGPYGTTDSLKPKVLPSALYPADRIESLMSVIPEIRQTLSGIKEGLTSISAAMKESGRQQADMVKILREINNSLTESGRKKRWFHLGSK